MFTKDNYNIILDGKDDDTLNNIKSIIKYAKDSGKDCVLIQVKADVDRSDLLYISITVE